MTTKEQTTALVHDDARALRIAEAMRLRREGVAYRAIAKQLGVSVSTAHELVHDGLHDVVATLKRDADLVLASEIERLDTLIAVSFALGTGAHVRDDDGEIVVDERTGKPRRYPPDPRYIERALAAISLKAKLLGLDVQRLVVDARVDGAMNVAPVPMDFSSLTPGQVAALELLLERARVLPPATATNATRVLATSSGEPDVVEVVDVDVDAATHDDEA